MNGSVAISTIIPATLILFAVALLAFLYNESHERKQLLLAIVATFVASLCLVILIIVSTLSTS